VHQVGSKDSGSQNFTLLALMGKAVGVTQILCTTAATARDRRNFFMAQIMLVIHKKSRKMKISDFFSFFSTLNQYFSHNLYVASKKWNVEQFN
jgi:hypothetical protein